jgi:hypothetical protein
MANTRYDSRVDSGVGSGLNTAAPRANNPEATVNAAGKAKQVKPILLWTLAGVIVIAVIAFFALPQDGVPTATSPDMGGVPTSMPSNASEAPVPGVDVPLSPAP